MQLLFYLVYFHSTCFGHGSCPSSGVIHKTVKATTSVGYLPIQYYKHLFGYLPIQYYKHLFGYLPIQYYKDARYHEHKIITMYFY